jgi:hypothetical protein
MSFPPATEMFQFAGFASPPYEFRQRYPLGWVAPFGDPGINDRSHLPRAFRSVPRPSSPLSAKASTRCPYVALERHTQRQGPYPAEPQAPPRSKPGATARQAKPRISLKAPDPSFARSCLGAANTPSPGGTKVPPFQRRHIVAEVHHTAPGHAHTRHGFGPRTVSRYGHTTRFFTIVHQQMPSRPEGASRTQIRVFLPRCTLASRRLRRKRLLALSQSKTVRVKAALSPEVEVIGIEPTTPCLQSRCSPS